MATNTVSIAKGTNRGIAKLLARLFLPGVGFSIAVHHLVVLPTAAAPVAAWLGLQVS